MPKWPKIETLCCWRVNTFIPFVIQKPICGLQSVCEKTKLDDRAQHQYCDVWPCTALVLFSHHVMLHVLASVTNSIFGNNHFHGYIDRQKEKTTSVLLAKTRAWPHSANTHELCIRGEVSQTCMYITFKREVATCWLLTHTRTMVCDDDDDDDDGDGG